MKLLPENTILLVEVGSTAHGTGIDGQEDHDETAIVVESMKEILWRPFKNQMHRTKPEGVRSEAGDTDRQLYSLRSLTNLCLYGNPSMLLVLWAPVIKTTLSGNLIRRLGPDFVSRLMIPKFRGYMQGQTLRLLGLKGGGHGKRGSAGREELIAAHGYDTKYAMHAARLGFQCRELLRTRNLELPIPGWEGDWLRSVRRGEIPFDEWWDTVLRLDIELEYYQSDESIPEYPNYDKIYPLVTQLHRDYWSFGLV